MECNLSSGGAGRPIMFLPGLFAGGWIWRSVAESVRGHGYRAVVFDEAIPIAFAGRYKVAEEALLAATDQCETPPVLVGNSMGALIGLEFTRRHPDRVSGLVMSGSPGLSELNVGVSLHDLRTGERRHVEALAKRIVYDQSLVTERGVDELSALFTDGAALGNVAKWLIFSRRYDVHGAVDSLRHKPRLIWGRHDVITPLSDWEALANERANVELSVIDNSGHSPMFETPQQFSELLLRAATEEAPDVSGGVRLQRDLASHPGSGRVRGAA